MQPANYFSPKAVLVAAPPCLHRRGLLATLHEHWPMLTLNVTADAGELVPLLRRQSYALVVVDSALAGPSLGGLLEQLRGIRSCQPILVLAGQRLAPALRQHLFHKQEVGALLPHNATPATVVTTIMSLLSEAAGGTSSSAAAGRRFAPPTPFSQREVEVLRLVVADYCNQEIADQLCVSVRTVESHRRALLQKAGAKTLVGLVVQAVREGWVGVA